MATYLRRALLVVTAAAALTATGAAGASAAARAGPGTSDRPAHPMIAYIVNTGANTVIPLNTATDTLGAAITVGLGPDAIVFTPGGKTAYVANGAVGSMATADTVTVIDNATNTIRKTIRVGTNPTAMAIAPDGKTVYVASVIGLTSQGW